MNGICPGRLFGKGMFAVLKNPKQVSNRFRPKKNLEEQLSKIQKFSKVTPKIEHNLDFPTS